MTSADRTHTSQDAGLEVLRTDEGWEIVEHRGNVTVRLSRHTDWHRVERSLKALEDANRQRKDATS